MNKPEYTHHCRECGAEIIFEKPKKFIWWEFGGTRMEEICCPAMTFEDGTTVPAGNLKVNVCPNFSECPTELPHLTEEELNAWIKNAPRNVDDFDFHKRY